ncbi:MAG: rod-binding protein [Bacteriovoracia bacterium]
MIRPEEKKTKSSQREVDWVAILLGLMTFFAVLGFPRKASSMPSPALNQRINENQHEQEMKQAAKGLESILVEMMIQEMRKSVPQNDIIPVSQAEKIYRQMLDSEYAKVLVDSGSIGIADLVVAQFGAKR